MSDPTDQHGEGEEGIQKPKKQHKISIVDSHMPSDKERAALEIATDAVDEHDQLMDIAGHIKSNYDKRYPGSGKATEAVTQCNITLRLYAACVSHETREYIHLQVDMLHILIWKSKDTPFRPEIGAA